MADIEESEKGSEDTIVELTARVVAAYVSENVVPVADLPVLINDVHKALRDARSPAQPKAEAPTPAVPVKRSVKKDEIICLECGKGFKSLKRHLRTHHGIESSDYRAKWGLDASYPMVAPAYAEQRAALAREMGLGQKPRSTRRKKAVSRSAS